MTKEDYISLVNEFGLEYDTSSTTAYYNKYPICGYRMFHASFKQNPWDAKSLIIFENYSDCINESGHYSGEYVDKFSTTVKEASKLIVNQIRYIKNLFINKRFEKMNEDF